MKKIMALLLVLVLTVSMVTACSKKSDKKDENTATETTDDAAATTDDAAATDDASAEVTNAEPTGQIIVGEISEFNGSFIEGWGNNGGDAEVKSQLGTYPGFYGTAEMSSTGEYVFNKTVLAKDVEITDNEDGSRTFKYTLNDGLKWSDGSALTAKDYVGYFMIYASPEFAEIEGANTGGNTVVGYADYSAGKSDKFAGVHLIDDLTFSVTVSSEYMPTYYEAYSSACTPIPFSVYAPGVEIKDDPAGAYLSDNYTAEVIKKPMTDQRYAPTVTCGPYKFVSYDSTNQEVVLEVNENFAGNYEGKKPAVQKLIYKYVKDETAIDELAAGNIDMLTGVSGGDRINAGLDLVDQGKVGYATYLRNGYGLLAFHTDFGPTQFKSVRQAIAYCLDRVTFCSQYTGGFGALVHSEYGLGQWMYQERKDQINSELNPYAFSIETAIKVLEEDGWTLNEKGDPFVAGTDKVRYKDVDGKLMACEIQWADSDNPVAKLVATMLPSEMEKAGMKLTPTVVDFPTLLNNYYREGIDEPFYNMYNLGTGFSPTPIIQYSYNPDKQYLGDWNSNFWMDDKISKMGYDLDKTDPSDKEGYLDKWVAVMKEINDQCITIPLYSDEYHTFYNPKIQGYIGDDMFNLQK
ncbi:MAG TPA: ABC transporter substrate-binding protein [Lachnospiraceae bacterium]|nr:ABC transporter substrate-binding protein [Lachnospiraceae bacterium]